MAPLWLHNASGCHGLAEALHRCPAQARSGKIVRRILRSLAAGEEVSGDTSTLEDRSVLDDLDVHGRKVC
jgi:hypothetical protein